MNESSSNDATFDNQLEATKSQLLLVEDQQDVRAVFSLMLSSQGFHVHEAATLESAIEFCKQQLPAVALVDADLDGDDGMALGCLIRGTPGGAKVVLGALTGNESATSRQKARKCGFDFYFIKPVKIKEVCEVINDRMSGVPPQPHCRWSLDKI